MSRTRRAGLAAYRKLIEAVPDVAVDALDRPLTNARAGRAQGKDAKAAALWSMGVRTPSKWYATDGSGSFYYFRRRKVDVELMGFPGIGRLPVTVYGVSASQAYYRHGGQLTNRRPSGFLSVATLSAASFGGLDGGPRDWGWTDNEDLDLNIDTVIKLRAKSAGPNIRGSLWEFSEVVVRQMERAA